MVYCSFGSDGVIRCASYYITIYQKKMKEEFYTVYNFNKKKCLYLEALTTSTRLFDVWISENKLRRQLVLYIVHFRPKYSDQRFGVDQNGYTCYRLNKCHTTLRNHLKMMPLTILLYNFVKLALFIRKFKIVRVA